MEEKKSIVWPEALITAHDPGDDVWKPIFGTPGKVEIFEEYLKIEAPEIKLLVMR